MAASLAAVAVVVLRRPDTPAASRAVVNRADPQARLDAYAVAVSKRFYDLDRPDFGYGRMIPPGTRSHGSPAGNVNGHGDERGVRYVSIHGGRPGDQEEMFERFVPDTAEERQVSDALGRDNVVLYVSGLLGTINARTRGPALATENVRAQPGRFLEDAPVPVRLWNAKDERSTTTANGWLYAGYRIRAEASCLKCHNEMQRDAKAPALKAGDPVGLLILARQLAPTRVP